MIQRKLYGATINCPDPKHGRVVLHGNKELELKKRDDSRSRLGNAIAIHFFFSFIFFFINCGFLVLLQGS